MNRLKLIEYLQNIKTKNVNIMIKDGDDQDGYGIKGVEKRVGRPVPSSGDDNLQEIASIII